MQNTKVRCGGARFLSRFIPYPAVAGANVANLVMMRWRELATGVDVLDGDGAVRGKSKAAAKVALWDTAITRVVLPTPILVLSPLLMKAVRNEHALPPYSQSCA